MKKTLIYDCEIANCIPDGYYRYGSYRYCEGWHDFAGMGVAVVGVYTDWDDRYHYFLASELNRFQELVDQADEIVGFNSLSFDDNLMQANNVKIQTTYDLLAEVRVAAGMPPHYVRGVTRAGYSLNELAFRNLGVQKTGQGDEVPKQWQDGKFIEVIDYCLNDVRLLKELYDRRSALLDPTEARNAYLKCRNSSLIDRTFRVWNYRLSWLRSQWSEAMIITKPFWWAVRHGKDLRKTEIRFIDVYPEFYRKRSLPLRWRIGITIELGFPIIKMPSDLKWEFGLATQTEEEEEEDYEEEPDIEDIPF